MTANCSFSSSSNLSLHPPPPSPLNSSLPIYDCSEFSAGSHIFTTLCCAYMLFFLPLFIFILHLGHQQWRKQRPVSAATPSNADLFTYNIISMEMIGMLGCCFYCAGAYTNTPQTKMVGIYIFNIITPGQMFFHILTCVERYLAVIHPILYLGLKNTGGVRIRNISIGCVWAMSLGWMGITTLYSTHIPAILYTLMLVFSITVTSYCSFSVLRFLIRPVPGERGGDRHKVDQLKRRAFHTVMAITGALLLKFGGELLRLFVDFSKAVSYSDKCVVLMSVLWTAVPSSCVLPLLFLHRAGKLPCFKHNTESGRGSDEGVKD